MEEEIIEIAKLVSEGIGFLFLLAATCLMLHESTCELQYLLRVWRTNELKYKIPFLILVFFMYVVSFSPIAMGVIFFIYKSRI